MRATDRPIAVTLRAQTALQATLLTLLLGFSASAQAVQDTTTHYQYDAQGNPTKATSPLDTATNPVATDTGYDSLDRATDILQPLPGGGQARPHTQLDHDGQDQLTWVNDPRANQTTYSPTGLGDLTATASPDSGAATATYDAAGNLKSRTDARGKTTLYSTDAQDRLTKADYPTGTDTVYTYDGGTGNSNPANIGRLTRIDDESGSTTYSYDPLGRVTAKTRTLSGNQPLWVQTVSYSYGTADTANGKLASVTYPSGNRINYSYDANGRISGITLNPTNSNGLGTNTAVTTVILNSIQYTPSGQFYSGAWGNHTPTSWSGMVHADDLDGRIASYHLGNPSKNGTFRTLHYDAASRVTGYTHTGTGTGAFAPANFDQGFSYDNLGRVTGTTGPAGNQAYAYDATGNRTATGTNTQTIDGFSNRLLKTAASAPNRTYDLSGNLLNDGSSSYAYSDRGLLQTVTDTTTGFVNKYLYDGLGQRVKKYSVNTFAQYSYDEQGHLLGEYDIRGLPLQETVYLGDLPVAVLKQSFTGDGPRSIYIDNTATGSVAAVGPWPVDTAIAGYYGTNYQTHAATTATTDSFTWNLALQSPGLYYLYVRWTADATRASNASYTFTGADGSFTASVDQRARGNTWIALGMPVARPGNLTASLKLATSNLGSVAADAVVTQPIIVSTSVNYVFTDHLGTPRVITRSSDNQMVWRWDNADPFGAAQPNPNPSGLGNFVYNPRFPGQLYDTETGLYYNNHRYYSPGTGTYYESDLIGLAGGINTYAYVGGNPVNFTDPTGLIAGVDDAVVIGGGVVVGSLYCAIYPDRCRKIAEICVNGIKKFFNEANGDSGDKHPSTPTGQRGGPMDVPRGTNAPTNIDGRDYTGHALDQMQGRGLTPTPVEDAIRNGQSSPGNQPGTTVHSGDNGVTVVTGENGQVITVIPK
ncbi:hypothetical protein MGMO_15c00500 [Methyloglobulus morosus KoM1]|uniref:RHS repeat-associated core domain-containing protein n=1 Tax=Methyloglobulus morosus KoM1 TaxID=1116472 RepID=V5C0M1_9GAMM|nr:RHS repeat-associated core domain-containing protein [Methyloglobulus morosus]ESS73629.1 hypothetical protein MGMO_15c00500 [Methyloglobulus morosus KoM1]